MTSPLVKLLLFGSSYAPLGVIFFFLYSGQDKPVQAQLSLGLSILCVLVFLIYFRIVIPRRATFSATVVSFSRRDGDTLSYVATYLLPFVTVPFSDTWQQTAAILFFLGILAIVYVNSDLIAVNPLLVMMGYHLYEISIKGDAASYLLLMRDTASTNSEYWLADISEGIYLKP